MNTTPLDNKLTIKQLEFVLDDFTQYQTATPIDGLHYNVKYSDVWEWRFGVDFFRFVRSEEAAKAACQADWLERIGNALC